MNHFDEMTAFLYLDGQLERVQASEVLTHTAACPECRVLLESLKRETLWLEQSLQEKDPVPARFAAPGRHANVRWGWATALAMGIAGVLTLWNGVVEPFEHQLNQAGFGGGNLMTMLFFSGAFWRGWSSLLAFFGFFAATIFCILALFFLRRFWRGRAVMGVVLASFFAVALALPLLLTTPAAEASEMVHGHPSYTLPAGQTVNTDLFVAADFARIEGTVNGDVITFSGIVEIDGHVTGDVISMGREVRINGQVDGNLRGYASTISVNGSVGKNVLAACGEFELGPNGKIGGNITLGAGNVMISGSVAGGVTGAVSDMTMDGTVGEDLKIRGDNLRIGPSASIRGVTKYKGRHEAIVDPSAKLGSALAYTELKEGPDYSNWKYYWHRAEFWGAAFLFGLVLLLLVPQFFRDTVRASKKVLPSLGFGILFFFATPIVAAIVCITVVGIGLSIPTILIWLVAVYAAQVFVASWLGEILLGPAIGTGALLGRLALGLAIIHGLEIVRYHVGFVVHVVVLWWGLGAIAIAAYRHLKRTAAVASPVAA